MARERESTIDIDFCRDIFDIYVKTMNNIDIKNIIVNDIFQQIDNSNILFLGSYYSLPQGELGIKIKEHFGDQLDAKPYEEVLIHMIKNFKQVLTSKNRPKYITFLLGTITSYTDDVSHHMGFVYGVEENILKILDPGIQSWGPACASLAQKLCTEIFDTLQEDGIITETGFLQAFSDKWYNIACLCKGGTKCGPQDITRGGTLSDVKTYISTYFTGFYGLHRETFCQTWSILLILVESQNIIRNSRGELKDYYFQSGEMSYWKQSKRELEICIREFILWIVYNNKKFFQDTYKEDPQFEESYKYKKGNYINHLLLCFRDFNNSINIPINNTICGDVYMNLSTFSDKNKKKIKFV